VGAQWWQHSGIQVAAEKRTKVALSVVRDISFQRDGPAVRESTIKCNAGIASGWLPSCVKVQEKALHFVVNVLFTKNEKFGDLVLDAAMEEIDRASQEAINSFDARSKLLLTLVSIQSHGTLGDDHSNLMASNHSIQSVFCF
jgi:hypothetical protein